MTIYNNVTTKLLEEIKLRALDYSRDEIKQPRESLDAFQARLWCKAVTDVLYKHKLIDKTFKYEVEEPPGEDNLE